MLDGLPHHISWFWIGLRLVVVDRLCNFAAFLVVEKRCLASFHDILQVSYKLFKQVYVLIVGLVDGFAA